MHEGTLPGRHQHSGRLHAVREKMPIQKQRRPDVLALLTEPDGSAL